MSLPPETRIPRDTLLTTLTVAALLEMVWTAYLGLRLPRHYVANHWDLAWVGLDAAQIVFLLLTAWAAWRRRAVLISFASSAAMLLLVDAWFDVTTARRGDVFQSGLMAVVLEVPASLALFWVARVGIGQFHHVTVDATEPDRIAIRKMELPPRVRRVKSRHS